MAVVAHTPYAKDGDMQRTNEYVTDGHGTVIDRTNRYIGDGHGGHTLCEGYNCPSDPVLATAYMATLRANYERRHSAVNNEKKSPVVHEHIYMSPTEADNVPPWERMEMVRELIQRTFLRDFASIYVPHDNTPDKHVHISICPYSIDGTHKLCLNMSRLNELRRTMDRICVEHGYSIIENPELMWGDKEYREWFQAVKAQGIVKIHPPRDQDMTSFKKDRNRARTYAASKDRQQRNKEAQETYYKKLTAGYTPEKADLFYTPPHLYDLHAPGCEIHIRRIDKEGKERNEMELATASLFVWAYRCKQEIKRRNIAGSDSLQKRMQTLANKAMSAKDLLQSLDIRTHTELIQHIKECGQDIAELKQDIKRQDTIICRMHDLMEHIDRWENSLEEDACAYLKAHRCFFPEEISDAKKRYANAATRKAAHEELLAERSAEYRHLKEAEATLRPIGCEQESHGYLETVFAKEINRKIGYTDEEKLVRRLYSMGTSVGLSRQDIDGLMERAKQTARKTTWVEYRAFMRVIFTQDSSGVSAIYDQIRETYADIRFYWELIDDFPVIGPFTFLLGLAVAFYAGWQIGVSEMELEQLRWDIEIQKEYARKTRREQMAELRNAKTTFDEETRTASEKEILAARTRFYEYAAQITGQWDLIEEIEDLRQRDVLDKQIEEAVGRTIASEFFEQTEQNVDYIR